MNVLPQKSVTVCKIASTHVVHINVNVNQGFTWALMALLA